MYIAFQRSIEHYTAVVLIFVTVQIKRTYLLNSEDNAIT